MPKKRKSGGRGGNFGEKRELIFVMEGQVYAEVIKALGSCRFEIACSDGVKRLGHVRGAMHKKRWINRGDMVVACPRDFQDSKADIIHIYTSEEVRVLRSKGEIVAIKKLHEGEDPAMESAFIFSNDDPLSEDVNIDDI